MADWEDIYANLRRALRFFGEATGKGEVRQLNKPSSSILGSNTGSSTFRCWALQRTPARAWTNAQTSFSRTRADGRCGCAAEDALSPNQLQQLRSELARHHLTEISRAPGMVLTEFAPPRRELPAIKLVPVDSDKLRETFGRLASVCFDIPSGVAREVYYPARAWNGAYRGYVGMVAGRPVGVVALVRTGDTLGVYSLGVDPQSRGLGYGEALLRQAVEGERAKGGVARVVLQSSESGQSLYRHMGFREVAQFSVHLRK